MVFVGAATWDAIALVARFPEPDDRVVAEEIRYAGGGPAATAAVAAARLGLPATFVGTVGDDHEGRRIVEDLQSHAVDANAVMALPQRRSGASVIVVDKGRGTRAICTRPIPPPDLASGSPAAAAIRAAAWVHVDHLGWTSVSDVLADVNAEQRPRLSVDGGNPIPGFTPAGVDLFVPTLTALTQMYGEQSPDELLDAALAAGADTVVATCGAEGAIAATAGGERCAAPAHQVEVVSTLGAGDVFHGALLAAILADMPLRSCLSYANVVAAISCASLDGRSAIPTHLEALACLPAPTG